MGRSRGSIFGLMAVVLFFALALTAIRSASDGWVRGTCNASVAILFLASIRARFAPTEFARAWWFGFALCGWTYYLAAAGPFREQLLTSGVVNPAHLAIFEAYRPIPASVPYSNANHEVNLRYAVESGRVFHNFATIALAYLGAFPIALAFGRTARRADAGRPGADLIPDLDP